MLFGGLTDGWPASSGAPDHSVYPTVDLLFATRVYEMTQWMEVIQAEAPP